MNTPAHLIFGAAAFARPGCPGVTLAALLGALAPDLSLYLMTGWHMFVIGTDPRVIFNVLYYSDTWQAIFAVDNSFFIWGGALGIALWLKRPALVAFAGAGLLHLCLDFPLHNDDARAHFWPMSDWKFISPVSYWDRDHYGGVIGPLEMLASLICLCVLWRRFSALVPRVLCAMAACLQLAPVFIWVFVFDG